MRVLLSTYGSRGDVEPLAGLAVALRARGVEALVSAPPEPEFVALLARAGVEMAPAFMPVRQWIDEAKGAPISLPQLAARMIPAQYESIGAAAEGCDAIVATGLFPSVAAAQCVAEKRGLPYAFVAFCPLSLPSHDHRPIPRPGRPHPADVTDPRALWNLNIEDMDALFGGAINGQHASIGLPTLRNVRDHVFTRRPLLASDPTLWPWRPTDLCEPVQTGAWVLPDPRPLPSELEAFLGDSAPPVYVGFGSIALPSAKDAARTAIQAIRALGRRVVLARGWADNVLADDLDDGFLIGEVNQQALFKRVAAVVHHGGAGTTTTAARAGAPQVIVPQIVDQPYWAARVAGLGIAVAHDGPAPTVQSLSLALETALAPETRGRALAVARSIRTDGAMMAAKLLLETPLPLYALRHQPEPEASRFITEIRIFAEVRVDNPMTGVADGDRERILDLYRPGCWGVSAEVSNAVTQIQKTTFEFARKRFRVALKDDEGNDTGETAYSIEPRSYLIIGDTKQLDGNDDKITCFELYRRNIRSPEILTFDELLYRARFIVQNLTRDTYL